MNAGLLHKLAFPSVALLGVVLVQASDVTEVSHIRVVGYLWNRLHPVISALFVMILG